MSMTLIISITCCPPNVSAKVTFKSDVLPRTGQRFQLPSRAVENIESPDKAASLIIGKLLTAGSFVTVTSGPTATNKPDVYNYAAMPS